MLCLCELAASKAAAERLVVEEKPLPGPRIWLGRRKEKHDSVDSLSTENRGCRLQRSIVFSGH